MIDIHKLHFENPQEIEPIQQIVEVLNQTEISASKKLDLIHIIAKQYPNLGEKDDTNYFSDIKDIVLHNYYLPHPSKWSAKDSVLRIYEIFEDDD